MSLASAIANAISNALRPRMVGTVSGTVGSQVVVVVNGSTVTLPYLSSYSPMPGDVVHVDTNGPGWLVLGTSA